MNGNHLKLMPGLSAGIFAYEDKHALLAKDAWKECGPNIGKNGENLTISILSLNRVSLTEKLLLSIQTMISQFAGEILIIDNGSSPATINRLKEVTSKMSLKTRLVELGQNYGPSVGRNRAISYVNSEWIMSLDNDMYFIANPLPQLQKDIAVLGCHFIGLPHLVPDENGALLEYRGGHLSVSFEDNEIYLNWSTACPPRETVQHSAPPFLSSFFSSTAYVANCKTFLATGGYDENLFCLEDPEFSLRIFQQGYKIGIASGCTLIHDHLKLSLKEDREYDRLRFDMFSAQKCAEHFERKHNLKIWNKQKIDWMELRRQQLGVSELKERQPVKKPNVISTQVKPKIALIIDTENWCFGNIARQLQLHLQDKYEFFIIPTHVISNIEPIFLMAKDCDVLHFFWTASLAFIDTPHYHAYARSLGLSYEQFHQRFLSSKRLSLGIFDNELFKNQNKTNYHELFRSLSGYTVCSEKLNTFCSNIPGIPSPSMVTQDGVDFSLFKPLNINRLQQVKNRELVIGWVGNSQWGSWWPNFNVDHKGLHTIFKPAIAQLQQEGLKIQALIADRNEGFIPHDQMANYYSQIDVLVCSSMTEGTPNPVLEAMACGVPVVSTDVGVVAEAFGPLQKECILPERSIEALKAQIRRLVQSPELLSIYSAENMERIKNWSWKIKAEKYGEFFECLLKKHIQ